MENNQHVKLNGNNNEDQSIFHNLSDRDYQYPFFPNFEDHLASSENNTNYLNLTPSLENQQTNQISDNNSIYSNSASNNYSQLFYPPAENAQNHQYSNLMDTNETSKPQYFPDLTAPTTQTIMSNKNPESSLLTLFQKAIANPEEKNALMKLFRQITVPDCDEKYNECLNRPQPPQNFESYPYFGYASQSQSNSYSNFNKFQSKTTNSSDNHSYVTNLVINTPPNYNGPKNITDQIVIPNFMRDSLEDKLNPSQESETFETAIQTSDSQYSENRSREGSSESNFEVPKYNSTTNMQNQRKNLRKLNQGSSRKIARRHNSLNFISQSDTSSFSHNRSRRKHRNCSNSGKTIDANTIPSLFKKFPKCVGILHIKNVLQPDMFHRARYLTEGSRTTLRDATGTSYPAIKLVGFEGRAKLHVFIGVEGNTGMPSLFYQISRASFKNSTDPREITVDGINVLEYDFSPDQHMTLILDGIGILKLRNSDVEHRFGLKTRKKTSKCCLVYRAIVPYGDMDYSVVQARSNSIVCVQPMGNPEITKVIPPSAFPGNELAIIGKNFLKNAFVLFYDNIIEADNPSGKKYSWSVQAVIDSDLSTPMHIVCKVPFYPEEYAIANGSTDLNVIIRCNNKSSKPISFLYKNPNCSN